MEESNDKKAIKSGFWYVFANFATRGIGFLTMPVFVRLMTKEDIGQFVNFTTWIALLVPVFTLSLDASVPVASFDFKDKKNEYISSVLALGSIITTGFYAVSLILEDQVKGLLNIDSMQLHIMFVYIMFEPSLSMLQIKSKLEYRYKLSTVLSLLSVGLSTPIALLAVILSEDKLRGRILGFYIPMILLNICIYRYFFTKSKTVKMEYWKYGAMISIPLALNAVAGSVLNSFDKIMINSMVGDSETALYSVGYSCATLASMLWYSLNQAWAPWAYEQMDQDNRDKLKKVSKIYMLEFGLIVLVFMLTAPELLWIIGGSTYSQALDVIPPVMCGFVFQLVYSLYVNIETLEKKTVYVAVGTVAAAIINIVLNFMFIPVFGYVAAAYTTLAGYTVLFLMHFFFVCRMGKTYWYDSRFNFIYLLIFTLITTVMPLIYGAAAVRYIILAGIAAVLLTGLMRRKKLIDR